MSCSANPPLRVKPTSPGAITTISREYSFSQYGRAARPMRSNRPVARCRPRGIHSIRRAQRPNSQYHLRIRRMRQRRRSTPLSSIRYPNPVRRWTPPDNSSSRPLGNGKSLGPHTRAASRAMPALSTTSLSLSCDASVSPMLSRMTATLRLPDSTPSSDGNS